MSEKTPHVRKKMSQQYFSKYRYFHYLDFGLKFNFLRIFSGNGNALWKYVSLYYLKVYIKMSEKLKLKKQVKTCVFTHLALQQKAIV